MEEEDVASVVQIERMSFSTPWPETSFLKEIYKPRAIIKAAEVDEAVVGYISVEYVLDEAHILNLAVHPDYRRMGIATALVEYVIERLRERACRFLYLEVRASNRVARLLYEGFGFRIIGRRKNYYISPVEDGLIMMLDL